MIVNSNANQSHQWLIANHKLPKETTKYSVSTLDVMSNLSKVAIPIIAILALSNLSVADAGPMAYGVCTTVCLTLASPLAAPFCIGGCLPALAAPTP